MLKLLCQNSSHIRRLTKSLSYATKSILNGTHSRFLENPSPKSITHLSNRPKEEDPSPTTVSYLVNSCGLSSESALKASKRFRIVSVENADSVLALFKNHGFDQTQLSRLITRYPAVLMLDPDKILKPKMEFLQHRLDISSAKLTEIVSVNPLFLTGSLEKRIRPSFDLLSDVVGTDENAIVAITRMPGLLCMDLHKILLPKEALLRKHGVSASVISKWIMKSPRNLTVCDDRFSEVVAELKMMGFDPSRPSYLYALHTMLGVSSSNWKRKCEAYKSLGWSDDELLKLFKKHPFCIAMSETKLRKAMEFLTKCLGWDICTILKNPCCLAFSMEKRMLPRYKVMQMLLSNGLLKKDFCWSTVFGLNEKNFLKKFVNKYQGEAPKLMDAYCKEMSV